MMNRISKYSVVFFAYMSVAVPLYFRYEAVTWSAGTASILYNLFPGFGLTAFSLLWLHALSGVFEPWLRKNFNFDRFVKTTAIIILASIILHPLLLFAMLGFSISGIFSYGNNFYIWLGIIGFILLLTYDAGKILIKLKYDFFSRHWNKILVISTIGFLIAFFHSMGLGHDLQSGPLRYIWIFYGITAVASTIYTYGIRRFRR